MWLVASIMVSVTGGVACIGLGVAVAIAFDRFTHGARALAPKTWCVVTVTTVLVLALAVPRIGRQWLPEAQFFAWLATACFTAGFGFCLAWRRSFALSQVPDEVDQPRLSGERPATRRLVIYGQEAHHGSAYIVGSRDALEALGRAAATAASEPRGVGATPLFFPGDGEGFQVLVVRAENDAFFGQLPLQYVADSAGGAKPEGQVRMSITAELQDAIRTALKQAEDGGGEVNR